MEPIKCTYAKLVSAIKSGRHLMYGAHAIPFDAFHSLALPLPNAEYWRAHERIKDGAGRDEILAALREGAPSGV